MNTNITLTKKSNTVYGFAWDIATAISHMEDQKSVWAEIFGTLSVFDIDSIISAQAEAEGYSTSEQYLARRPGNSGLTKFKKARGVRFSTIKLIEFGDRAGLNLSNHISI